MKINELEEILKDYKVTKPKVKGDEVENISIPSMLTMFRDLIKDGIPPTQQEFVSVFKENYPKLKVRGIVSRLKRAYLSYVREYHLGFLLKEHFNTVVYNERIDILGIDYIVFWRGHRFNIHAFVDTKNSRYWREVKNSRHDYNGLHVDLPMNLSKGKRVGRIIVYTDEHIVKLKDKMNAMLDG